MTLHELKESLQQQLSDGLVMIVGSGLSCAEGLPGMNELAQHLCIEIPSRIPEKELPNWRKLSQSIKSDGLEAALLASPATPEIELAIVEVTGHLIAERERKVISEVFSGVRILRLTRLIEQLLKPASGMPIITTNYDRLVEIAVEECGLGVDTMFVGRFAGVLNERESRLSFCHDISYKSKRAVPIYKRRAKVFKPHGSIDWYLRGEEPVHFSGDLNESTRLIITPGNNKIRSGYDRPFDLHRSRANESIDRASRFLILGYGFNDDHLETHLSPAIRSGKPTLLLTHTLTPNAQALVDEYSNVTALVWDKKGETDGTTVHVGNKSQFFEELTLWDVGSFVSEVLIP